MSTVSYFYICQSYTAKLVLICKGLFTAGQWWCLNSHENGPSIGSLERSAYCSCLFTPGGLPCMRPELLSLPMLWDFVCFLFYKSIYAFLFSFARQTQDKDKSSAWEITLWWWFCFALKIFVCGQSYMIHRGHKKHLLLVMFQYFSLLEKLGDLI